MRPPPSTIGGQDLSRSSWSTPTTAPSTDKALTAATQLVSEGVSLVLGSYGSGVSIAGGPTFGDAGLACHRRHLHQPHGHRRQ